MPWNKPKQTYNHRQVVLIDGRGNNSADIRGTPDVIQRPHDQLWPHPGILPLFMATTTDRGSVLDSWRCSCDGVNKTGRDSRNRRGNAVRQP